MERFKGWAAYNATCEPDRQWQPGTCEPPMARHDQVQDAENNHSSDEYDVLFLPGAGPADQIGNLVAWCPRLDSVVVLKRRTTLRDAQIAMLTPEPRLGTLQAIARSLKPTNSSTPQTPPSR
ncbi:hypothetical protein [Micromonospora aurantiaca (nom. illeg.)]|uniref:hypothetical protein n=1 Tax=Micromonospora aurantiaca (nom. illeg.) TaxID=47850 RepID=UPI0034080CB8